jgi:hypothetical protein
MDASLQWSQAVAGVCPGSRVFVFPRNHRDQEHDKRFIEIRGDRARIS